MRLNNKGFTLIEVMVVLVMTTVIIVPLLSGLSDSYKANQRAQQRSNALSVADGTVYAMDKINFDEYHDLVVASQGNPDYVELNETRCTASYFTEAINRGMCSIIFSQTANNDSYDENTFRIFLFDYKLTQNEYNNIMADEGLPIEVKNILEEEYSGSSFTAANVETLIKVVVWIEYYENPDMAITLEALLTGVTTDE